MFKKIKVFLFTGRRRLVVLDCPKCKGFSNRSIKDVETEKYTDDTYSHKFRMKCFECGKEWEVEELWVKNQD